MKEEDGTCEGTFQTHSKNKGIIIYINIFFFHFCEDKSPVHSVTGGHLILPR